VETICAWRASGQEAPAGPTRRPQRYAGTDRQVRGLLLGVLREATGPVPRQRLDAVWTDDVQRARALDGLVRDGLVEPVDADSYRLVGDGPSRPAVPLPALPG
jgi:A/G-specific adenine glycosylase